MLRRQHVRYTRGGQHVRYTREQQIVPSHASCLVEVAPPGVVRTGVVQRQQCVQKLDGGAFEYAAKDHQGDGQNGEELQVAAGVLHKVHRPRVMEELPGDPRCTKHGPKMPLAAETPSSRTTGADTAGNATHPACASNDIKLCVCVKARPARHG